VSPAANLEAKIRRAEQRLNLNPGEATIKWMAVPDVRLSRTNYMNINYLANSPRCQSCKRLMRVEADGDARRS
jgi:hypothetical protein